MTVEQAKTDLKAIAKKVGISSDYISVRLMTKRPIMFLVSIGTLGIYATEE